MAKNENRLSYLQLPIPKGRKYSKVAKRSWSGLNMRQTIDTGAMSMENNISTSEAPYLTPSPCKSVFRDAYSHPIGLFGFESFLVVIYREDDVIYVDYHDADGNTFTSMLKSSGADEDDEYPRSVVQFNVYDTPTDPVSGKYVKKLLIFPDKKSMDFEITEDNFKISNMDVLVKEYHNETENEDGTYPPPETSSHSYYYMNTYNNDTYKWVDDLSDSNNSGWKISVPPSMPNIKYAAVHLSRLFGVDNDRVYASGYNDYTNWNLDTADEYNESNAWCSPAQSNTKAGGDFTGITVFQNHVICFKHDFMHEIYNTKNPFRIQDIYAEGTIDNRTIQDVDGRLIFVSDDNVKIYTGSNPRIISYYLNMDKFYEAVSGTDGRNYYLYCVDGNGQKRMFVYDTIVEQWSERSISEKVLNFAHTKTGMYMLCDGGAIYKLDTNDYAHNWSFETDLITNETVDIKRIKKIQFFADIKESDGACIKFYILYDDEIFDETTSHLVYDSGASYMTVSKPELKSDVQRAIRIKPRQTAAYGIKIHAEGRGYVKLYEMELYMESGGNLYV